MSIKVDNLYFSYPSREVLKTINFEAQYGQFLSVLGPNGVGKSTLFRCMLGLLSPSLGSTYVEERDIQTLSSAELARKIAYIPQSHSPVFNFTVFDMVLMGTTAQMGQFSTPGKAQEELAVSAMERLGILPLKDRGYANISGGERQLTLIARAIAQQARILIMDEPSANLDFGNRIRLMQTIKALTKDGYLIIQSTHDPDQAYLYSDRILALHEGQVLAWGSPQETISDSLISTLYGVNVEIRQLPHSPVKVCVPFNIN